MTIMQDWVSLDGEVEIEFYLPCFRETCNCHAEIKVHWDACSCTAAGRIHLLCRTHFERHYFDRVLGKMYAVPTARCYSCGDTVEAINWRALGD